MQFKADILDSAGRRHSTAIAATFDEAGLFIPAVCLVLWLIGLVLEALSMLLIMVPVPYPSLAVPGIDPIWSGILFAIMIECALITPPAGLDLYVMEAVGRARMAEVATGVRTFIVLTLGIVTPIYALPEIALYIPFKL